MPRGSKLSEFERGKITALDEEGFCVTEIAKKLSRSRHVVTNFLSNPAEYDTKRRGGPKPKLSDRDRRVIIKNASNKSTSCSQLVNLTSKKVSKSTIWRVLHQAPNICRQKLKLAPHLTARHKAARMEFAKQHMATDWSQIIFSDEKKWNLDGPDGNRGYWRDLRKEPQIFSKRNFGGGSAMVWGAFSMDSKLELQFVSSKMKSRDYTNVLQCSLLPFLNANRQKSWIFQQDNAAIHTSRETKGWFSDKNIPLLGWPACSPDLNPIENIWGLLARKVYAENQQYNKVDDLKAAILREWDALDGNLLKNLINSMPKRIFKCIQTNGNTI